MANAYIDQDGKIYSGNSAVSTVDAQINNPSVNYMLAIDATPRTPVDVQWRLWKVQNGLSLS